MIRVLTLLAFFVLASCAPVTYAPNVNQAELNAETQKQRMLVAQEKIKKQAEAKEKRLKQQERLNRVATNILQGGLALCPNLNKSTNFCIYEFDLLEGGAVNAYADGKKLYITPAMIDFAKTDEELAIVLAHEYAHNLMEHISSQQGNALLGGLFGAVLDGLATSQGVNTGSEFTKAGAQMAALAYSADFEQEADYVGLYVMEHAGYDISNAPNFWRRMSIENPSSVFTTTTHPTNPHRFIALEKTVKEIADKKASGIALLPNPKPQQEPNQGFLGVKR